jgi:predicted RNA-binding Zn-ribbon protein involved in translation (DUF1610 family)
VADFLACPRCGERVDEIEGEEKPLSGVTKQLEPSGHSRPHDVIVVFCPHCGAVLGVLRPPS